MKNPFSNSVCLWVVFLLCISSCTLVSTQSKELAKSRVRYVKLYSNGLAATTKLPIDTSFVITDSWYLSKVDKTFSTDLDSWISTAEPATMVDFAYDYVRMAYVIKFFDGKEERIFIDRGGKHILYKNTVYEIDKPMARIIVKNLPTDSSKIHGATNKYMYNREKAAGVFTPAILKYGL